MTDPVAAKSSFLSTYMSNHPDTLVAYVAHFTGLKSVSSASMDSIDTNGMNMSYTLVGSSVRKAVRIPFDPPLMAYEEVRPRLLAMKVDAEEALGMIKNPTINGFFFPWKHMILGPTTLQLLLTSLTFSSSGYVGAVRDFLGPGIIKLSWAFIFISHPVESLYVAYLCRKHHTPLLQSTMWSFFTLLFGYPFILGYRSLVKNARIASIAKTS